MHSVRQSKACPAGQRQDRRAGRAQAAVPGLAAGIVVALAAAACSAHSGPGTAAPGAAPSPAASPPAAVSMLGAKSLPAQMMGTLPAFPAYYDAHRDVIVVTDAFPKAAALTFHVNYAPSLTAVKPATQPAWYIVRGRTASGQIAVLGSQPGETDYSPLWRTVIVRWQPGTAPKLLTSDNMILSLAKKGVLTVRTTRMVVNASVLSKA